MRTRPISAKAAALLLVASLAAACRDETPTAPSPDGPGSALAAVAPAALVPIDLGTLGGAFSSAYGMNAAGHVVGISATANGVEHAFLWTPAGGMQDLGSLNGAYGYSRATAVNDSGTVVGTSGSIAGLKRAFSRSSSGEWLDLGAPAGTNQSVAHAINNKGEIVGRGMYRHNATVAFLYRPGVGMVDLGLPAWARNSSNASDINDSSVIVGDVLYGDYSRMGFIIKPPGPMQVISTMYSTSPTSINNAGQVVGMCQGRPFVWDSAGGLRYLPGGAGGLGVLDIDDAGRIGGYIQGADGLQRAVLWIPDGAGGYAIVELGGVPPSVANALDPAGRAAGHSRVGTANRATLWVPESDARPVAPGGLAAQAVQGPAIELSWTDGSNNETHFPVLRSTRDAGGDFPPYQAIGRARANGTRYLDTTVAAGGTYRYQVQACNGELCTASAAATSTVPLPPAAPTGLTATAVSAARVDLAWGFAGSTADRFRVRRSTRLPDGTFAPSGTIATLPGGASGYADGGVSAGGTYRYQVQACNVSGCALSGPAVVTVARLPDAPAGLSATVVSATRIDLAWTDASTNESSFRVRWSARDAGGTFPPYQTVATLPAGATRFAHTTVAPDNVYRYVVQACNASGCTASPAVMATVSLPPSAPAGVVARAVSATRVEVGWTDASGNETSFAVQRSTRRPDGTFAPFQPIGTVGAGVTAFADVTVAGGGTYRYRVQACRNTSCASSASVPVTVPAP